MDILTQTFRRTETSLYFDLINFDKLNEDWIKNVIGNEFTCAEENDISLDALFADDPITVLDHLNNVTLYWYNFVNESITNPDTSNLDESLWTVLEDLGITVEKFQSFIYLLCSRAAKANDVKKLPGNPNDTLMILSQGLACARLYFNIMRVPSTKSFSVYNKHLFKLCISCFPAPDFTSTKEDPVIYNFDELSDIYMSALLSLIFVLREECHLADDLVTINQTVKKLCDLAACEVYMHLQFDIQYFELGEKELKRRFSPTTVIAVLAYEAFSAILFNDKNGSKDQNFLLIVSHLNKHISCSRAMKSSSVTKKHNCIKDNAVAFVCHHLRSQNFAPEATNEAMKRLCVGILDKDHIHIAASKAVSIIILHMTEKYRIELIEWLLLLIDSEEMRHRLFALNIFNQIFNNSKKPDTDVLPKSPRNDMLKLAIIFSILTRCEDEAAAVRRKALSVLLENVDCILQALDNTKDQQTFVKEVEDVSDSVLEFNGKHRFFWYNLRSFRERLNNIEAVLQRQRNQIWIIYNNDLYSREATLLAYEKFIMFDKTFINEENLKFFHAGSKDTCLLVREQAIRSAYIMYNRYKDNEVIQSIFLKCVMPLVEYNDITVKNRALLFLKKQFLQNIFSSEQQEFKEAVILLQKLSVEEDNQKYFKKAFELWMSEGILRPESILKLQEYVGTEWEACTWFYISNFSRVVKIPPEMMNLVVSRFEEFAASRQYSPTFKYLAEIISNSCDLLKEKAETVCRIIRSNLESFAVPFKIIPLYVESLYRIYRIQDSLPVFNEFSSSVVQKCEQKLLDIKSAAFPPESASLELIPKYFSLISEFCLTCASNITESVTYLLKIFSGFDPLQSRMFSPEIRAHAITALGKICLQDKKLANELIDRFATEMLSSKFDVIRNNLSFIMIDMYKHYPAFAEVYFPMICELLKDRDYLIRYQTFILIVNLLQEGRIKWQGQLFYCILSTLVDDKKSIRELGRYCFSELLRDEKSAIVCEHFIHTIFVFNYFCPPNQESVAKTVKQLKKFSIPGEHRRERRMFLYKFLLSLLTVRDKVSVYNFISKLLYSLANSGYVLDETIKCIIKDIFAILRCKESKVAQLEDCSNEVLDAGDLIGERELETRKIIDPVVRAIVHFKNTLTDSDIHLVETIIVFLKEFLQDFEDNLEEVLHDKVLLRQIGLRLNIDKLVEQTKKDNADETQNDSVDLCLIHSLARQISPMDIEH